MCYGKPPVLTNVYAWLLTADVLFSDDYSPETMNFMNTEYRTAVHRYAIPNGRTLRIRRSKPVTIVCVIAIFYLLSGHPILSAQSVTDGSTPLALKPGAPAGSYRLTDFEHMNYFNGKIS